VFRFTRNKKQEISQVAEQSVFYKVWGSLFYEFKIDEDSYAKYFYTFYTLKRIVYILSLMLFNNYQAVQAILNVLVMVAWWIFLVAVRPYSEFILQISNSFSEGFICLLFILLPILYFDLSDTVRSTLQDSVMYLTFAAIITQGLASVAIFIKSVVQVVKKHKNKRLTKQQTNSEPVEVIQQQRRDPTLFFRKP